MAQKYPFKAENEGIKMIFFNGL